MAIKQYAAFTPPSPYEQERRKAEQMRRYAELLQEQAAAEDEPFTYQGFRAMPSPAAALGKLLKAYGSKKAGEKAEEAEQKAREADLQGFETLRRELGPQQQTMGPDMFADPMQMGGKYTPPQMQTVMPTEKEREDRLMTAMASGSPTAQRYAQLMLAREPKTQTMEFGDQLLNVTDGVATPVTMGGKPVTATPKPAAGSSLMKLVNERDKFEPGDPRIAIWNAAISKETTASSPVKIDLGTKDTFKLEADLRGEVKDKLKEYEAVRNSYQKIENALKTGAGDIAVVYAFAKLNDPTSVVRESEFATVAKSGSFGQRIKNLVEQAQSGTMNPELRENLRQQARQMYLSQQENAENIVNQYRELAGTYKLDPNKVLAGINVNNLADQEDKDIIDLPPRQRGRGR